MKSIELVGIKLLRTNQKDIVDVSSAHPTFSSAERVGPAGFISDLRVDWSGSSKSRYKVTYRAVKNCFREQDWTGKSATFSGHLLVEAD
jgi:hypothetical protein